MEAQQIQETRIGPEKRECLLLVPEKRALGTLVGINVMIILGILAFVWA